MISKIKQIKKTELGFTLIEVMVVIIMVGILAAIAVPMYSNYVHRARTSEGVATLGAIKTFMLERSNATGRWPNETLLNKEFNDFNELYYFDNDTIEILPNDVGGAQDDALKEKSEQSHIAIRISIDPGNFGTPADEAHQLQLDIDTEVPANNGWSGTVRENWAKHLPPNNGEKH